MNELLFAFSDQNALAAAQMEALQNRLAEQAGPSSSAPSESSLLSSLVNTLSAAVTSGPFGASSNLGVKMYPIGRSECSVK